MICKNTEQTKSTFETYKKKSSYDANFDLTITKILIFFYYMCNSVLLCKILQVTGIVLDLDILCF